MVLQIINHSNNSIKNQNIKSHKTKNKAKNCINTKISNNNKNEQIKKNNQDNYFNFQDNIQPNNNLKSQNGQYYSDYSDYYDEEEAIAENVSIDDFESQPRDDQLSTTVIDLHELTKYQADFIVRNSIKESKKNRIGVFKFITGRGNHSIGKTPVLRPLVLSICKEFNVYCYVPKKNPGVIVCDVRRPYNNSK